MRDVRAWQLLNTCCWYALNSGLAACFSATARPAMVWLCGPPCAGRDGRQRCDEGTGPARKGPACLQSREDGEVDLVLNVVHDLLARLGIHLADALAVEDHGAARAAQRLVRGGGDHIRVLKGRRHEAGGHQAADVRHVRQQPRALLVGNGAHARVVVVARVRAGACAGWGGVRGRHVRRCAAMDAPATMSFGRYSDADFSSIS